MNVEMLVYGDRTWCSQACANRECNRNFTEEDNIAAVLWWRAVTGNSSSNHFPLAKADLKTDECGFVPMLKDLERSENSIGVLNER